MNRSLGKKTDRELITAMVNKDRKAWKTLYNRYADRLYSYLMHMSHQNENWSQDALQETFLKVFERAWQYNDTYEVSTWMFTIAGNLIKKEFHRDARFSQANPDASLTTESTESQVDRSLVQAEISRLLETLSEEHRHTYVLRFQQGFSIKEIAQILDAPEGTIKSRLFKITQLLTEKLPQMTKEQHHEN